LALDAVVARGAEIDQATAGELFSTAYRVAYRVLGSRDDAQDVAQVSRELAGLGWIPRDGSVAPATDSLK
jgi:hypothetical protein